MTFDQTLKQLEEIFLKMDLGELPQSRIKLAHMDAKLVSQINKLQKANQENQN